MSICRLIATSAVALAVAGALVAPASAYDGDWLMNQEFERTTNSSFTPGFNANDVDTALFQFNNRAKILSLRFDFFEAPSTESFTVYLGVLSGGVCTRTATVNIYSQSLFVTVPTQIPSRQWIPDGVQLIHTAVGSTPEGVGWRRDGLDALGYRWIRIIPGHYEDVPADLFVTIIDPDRYNRIATLNVSGVDGALTSQIVVNNTDQSWSFTFSHTLLNRLGGNCADIYIPGRAAPYRIGQSVGTPISLSDVVSAPAVVTVPSPAVAVRPVVVKPVKPPHRKVRPLRKPHQKKPTSKNGK